MTYLLRIDASPRHNQSFSRRLANGLEAQILNRHGLSEVKRRDLSDDPLPHITQDTITGFYTPENERSRDLEEATALSDALISELKGASALLLSVPMYNFSAPSSVKAWVDQIVRINQTFSFDGETFGGLVEVPTAYLAISYGAAGYSEGGAMRSMNFLEPYLHSLLSFVGIQTIHAFEVEGTTADEEAALLAERSTMARVSAHFAKPA